MQEDLYTFLSKHRFIQPVDGHFESVDADVFKEVRMDFVSGMKIPDIVIRFTRQKIVAIECKMLDTKTVIEQADFHRKWADYSYIAIPSSQTDKNLLNDCLRRNLGLIIWDPGLDQTKTGPSVDENRLFHLEGRTPSFVEIIDPAHNPYAPKGQKERKYRKKANEAIEDRLEIEVG